MVEVSRLLFLGFIVFAVEFVSVETFSLVTGIDFDYTFTPHFIIMMIPIISSLAIGFELIVKKKTVRELFK